jgi:hypothetical protein
MEPQNIQIIEGSGAIGVNTTMTHDEHIEWSKTHSGISGSSIPVNYGIMNDTK